MLVILCCRCPGAERLVRNKLSSCHRQDAFSTSIPAYVGREKALQYLDSLPVPLAVHPEIALLKRYLGDRRQFAVLLGLSTDARWADLNDSPATSMIDAEIIAEEY